MDNYKIMTKVSGMLSEYLETKGINANVTFDIKPIEKTLRSSWYVDKVKQCGHTECVYVDLNDEYTHAFFVVLEDGSIMTGGNIFISDAFITFDASMDAGEFIVTRPHLYKVYESDDDVCIITSIDGV